MTRIDGAPSLRRWWALRLRSPRRPLPITRTACSRTIRSRISGWAIGIGAKRKLAWVEGSNRKPSKVTLPANSWTLLTVAWTEDQVHIYRNDALPKSFNRNGSTPASSSGALVIGGTGAGAFSGPFAGTLDDVALYPTALTHGDVQEHFLAAQASRPTSGSAATLTGRTATTSTARPARPTW
jgi:hypothetical protein